MDFCGRCGTERVRGVERGRFCRACGHETPGNARYPLYADGTAAVTRPRPAAMSQPSTATAVVPRMGRHAAAVPPRADAAHGAGRGADATRPRLPVIDPAAGPPAVPAGAAAGPGSAAVGPVAGPPAAPAIRPDHTVTLLGLSAVPASEAAAPSSRASWSLAAAVTLGTLLVVVLLGLFLLTR